MPDPITGLIVGGGSLLSGGAQAYIQGEAAEDASYAQKQAAQMSIDEQRRQFDAIQALLKPYVEAGAPALGQQQALLGLSGDVAQQNAIAGIASSPELANLIGQGENALLQNASATGGLRGGNTQAALAQFRPQMLNQLIQQRYANLGGLTSLGQQSAAMQGTAGMQTGQAIAQQFGAMGQARAGEALAKGQAWGNFAGMPAQMAGMFAGFGGFGSGTPAAGTGAYNFDMSGLNIGGGF